jgi:hypothetical protein
MLHEVFDELERMPKDVVVAGLNLLSQHLHGGSDTNHELTSQESLRFEARTSQI